MLWGTAPEVHIKKLRIKQNKLLRAILDVEVVNGVPQQRIIDMYNNLGLLTVDNLYKLQLFKFLNLLLNGCLPGFCDLLLRPLLSSHNGEFGKLPSHQMAVARLYLTGKKLAKFILDIVHYHTFYVHANIFSVFNE